ncbi:hypothetical protein LTR02_014734 [Friedmanniomyces endolithicus]|nr:hypothetical protein LTR94_011747 [Friedmanniomyces endolithicus]KAK0790798.1 hypothetical protein LTR59_009108 [Friedmanniomyces endolithicus]KAK0798535.1 hypothetical protein LTR38_007842 [Friedmanniomyces endolithicus]KAK0802942.1 hypothetical protein LTR75_008119 [Friedmanniomyces endolithicus]KAK0842019.1 hypothetical protein LTR03_009544 [Friedmanniomyces endolithicus]
MTSGASQYIRTVLHHTESPPPVNARYFYTSPLPIDDPLSPVPPPASGKVVAVQPPKPFSHYDTTALDKAWHELRRKILRYHEEHGEKPKLPESSSERTDSGGTVDGGRRSGIKPAAQSASLAKQAASSLSQVDGATVLDTSGPAGDGLQSATAVTKLPDTTGTPFIRAPSGKGPSDLRHVEPKSERPKPHAHDTYIWEDASHLVEHSPAPEERRRKESPQTSVLVGVSRLHKVEMPELVMEPIYWTPIHDTAQVMRCTWFYQDTMLPVETNVANMLEAGYVDLQVWTETWKDELSSAVEAGAAGEMKIVHRLWPEKATRPHESRPTSRRGVPEYLLRTATMNLVEANETPEEQRAKAVEVACDIIDISSGPGGSDNKASGICTYGRQGVVRTYPQHGVIYANEREARILQPALMPSTYYGRRPLAGYIRKDHKLGVPVVRGFDQTMWDKLHPTKHSKKADKAEAGVATSASGAPPKRRRRDDPDLAKADRPVVSDLILVIHGIGQQLSHRMESFHFTHAMNTFRRDVNVEVGTDSVKARFRPGMGGIMLLPVNWRQGLSLEEGGYTDDAEDAPSNEFTLADITPDTLPSIRNIVSDVMLDVPYYMSHHQPKMIAAVIREANRVYQLWCQNNPGFASTGRVHLIGHSLGSVMAIDILSRQPTTIPAHLQDPTTLDLPTQPVDHFLFNTHNLFLAGSPAGFFLLLKKAQLRPRLDYPSAVAAADPTSNNLSICGEQGDYGCLPVENLYNVINGYDPVSYRMNAAIDRAYAASLKKAWIPTTTSSWFGSGSGSSNSTSATTWFAGSPSPSPITTTSPNPPSLFPRQPSTQELATHNFPLEHLAETRMRLLNDNGQIDYFLRYGGGPLEIQYWTMLGAHSSYWLLRDFVRMVVGEVGRGVGREGTGEGMRAQKSKVGVGGRRRED